MVDRNCLSYWFPRLRDAGVPVPRTEIVDAGEDWFKMLGIADGPRFPTEFNTAKATIDRVADGIREAASKVGGYPLFLRASHFSGKHDWLKTCFVPDAECVPEHVANLVYMSEMFSMIGELPYRLWCVRELLPTEPVAVLPAYTDMPLVKEVRAFVRDGRVVCSHPYWPAHSVAEGFGLRKLSPRGGAVEGSPVDAARLALALQGIEITPDDYLGWSPLAAKVAAAFAGDGAWSVDLLKTKNGWYVTDMAEAARSFHWDGCEHAASFTGAKQ